MSIKQIIDWLLNTPIEFGKAFAFLGQSSYLLVYFFGIVLIIILVYLVSNWIDSLSTKARKMIFVALVFIIAGAWQIAHNWDAYLKFLGVQSLPYIHKNLTGS